MFFLLLSGVCLSCILIVHLDCVNHNEICFASIEYELSMFGLEFDLRLMYLLWFQKQEALMDKDEGGDDEYLANHGWIRRKSFVSHVLAFNLL